MGTPHTGADLAQKGNTLLGRVLLRSVTFLLLKPSAVTASLERNDPTLRELNTWYREWCHDKEIRHLVLVESKSLPILGRIVKPDSSDPGLQVRPTSIDAHHINISKPSSKQDEIYILLKRFVEKQSLSKQACWLRSNFGKDHRGWEEY
ncbi:hypothetical protein, partial [Vibrio anguillarum]